MRVLLFACLALVLACRGESSRSDLEDRIKYLESQLKEMYKPGYGVTMQSIQSWHLKLKAAVDEGNWYFAAYALEEIQEAFEYLVKYHPNKPETKSINIIKPSIDMLAQSISAQDVSLFNERYELLTQSCNACHMATEHPYIKIAVPDRHSFYNIDFKWDSKTHPINHSR